MDQYDKDLFAKSCEYALKTGNEINIKKEFLDQVPFKYKLIEIRPGEMMMKNLPIMAIVTSVMGHGFAYAFRDLATELKITQTALGFMGTAVILITYSLLIYRDNKEFASNYVRLKLDNSNKKEI